ncbi:MAG: COG1470 family protein, partial [bacterium]
MKRVSLFAGILFSVAAMGTVSCSVKEADDFDLWTRSYLLPMERTELKGEGALDAVAMRVTPGEYEPAVFAVRAGVDQDVSVTMSLTGVGELPLPEDWVSLRRVTSLNEDSRPNRLIELKGSETLVPERTQFYWITVRPAEDASAGTYEARIVVSSNAGARSLALTCEVLPFTLQDSHVSGGAFMWLIDLPPGWYRDMKQHGLDAIQFFTWEWAIRELETDRRKWGWEAAPIKISRKGNGIVLDFTEMDRIMGDIDSAGMKGPVVVSLGNDHHLFYECRIAEEMGWSIETSEKIDGKAIIAPPVSSKLDRLYVDGLRQLRKHWEEKGYLQELIILIYDEPTERLLERAKNRYDLLKKAMPENRVYGVVMNRRDLAESMIDQMDIIVANGDFTANG